VFARSGGFARVRYVVEAIYDRAVDHEKLQRHFAGIDMARLIDHQIKMITGLMEGRVAFDDDTLRRAHARLKVNGPEFDALAGIVRQTLEEFGYPERDVEHVCREFERRRPLVVTGQEAA
jgi:hemoglobin